MHVFVTGAAGYIGQAVTKELISHGHTVLALVRSEANIEKITKLGATPHKGDLADPESLKAGAAKADGVIHLAFNHDFSNLAASIASDQANISAMGEGLTGTGKPLVIASGILLLPPGKVGYEDDEPERNAPMSGRAKSADLIYKLSKENNVRGMVMRIPPSVHGEGDQAFIASMIGLAQKNNAAIYVDDGSQRWSTVNRQDAAVAFRLALEKGTAGATYHVVGEEGVSMKDINGLIGQKLGVPALGKTAEEAMAALGFFGSVIALDNPASSAKTQSELGWKPTGPRLLEDMSSFYFTGAAAPAH